MSTIRRKIALWYDVNARILRQSPSGEPLRVGNYPWVTFREKPIVNLTLVTDATLTPYTGLVGGTLNMEAAVDYDFRSSLLMCKTLNAGFQQAGDWGSGGTADLALGQVSVRLNANTTGFQSKIGNRDRLLTTRLEVLVMDTDEGDELAQRLEMPFEVQNIVNDSGTVPEEMSQNFIWFTDPGSGAKCLRIVNDDGEVISVMKPIGV